jgi:hypothetical protein
MSSNTRSHNRSGLRVPAFANSMTLFAIACLVVAAALDLQGDADQAEGDTEDAHALWVELFAVKVVMGIWGAPVSGGSATGLSASGAWAEPLPGICDNSAEEPRVPVQRVTFHNTQIA